MLGKRKKRIAEAEAERLKAELQRVTEALEAQAGEWSMMMQQINEVRGQFARYRQNHPKRAYELAQRALDLLKYGPMFSGTNTDPTKPVYSRDDVSRGVIEIQAELDSGPA